MYRNPMPSAAICKNTVIARPSSSGVYSISDATLIIVTVAVGLAAEVYPHEIFESCLRNPVDDLRILKKISNYTICKLNINSEG